MHIRRYLLIFSLLISLPFTAMADAKSDLETFKAAIRSKYDMKEAAFRKKDPLPIVNQFYSADVVSVPPGNAMVQGREKLLEGYKQHMDSTVRIKSVKTYLNGDRGLDWANFYITPDNPEVKPFSFKILFIWEKRNGEWWCISDMFMVGEFPVATQ